jgi:hypothetical protein
MRPNYVTWHFDYGTVRLSYSGEWLVGGTPSKRSVILTDARELVDRLMGRDVVLPDWQEALIGTVMSEDGGYG